jgi:hypothetical protein
VAGLATIDGYVPLGGQHPVPVTCTHLDQIRAFPPGEGVCPQCVAMGSGWVHLRQCMVCGQVGCCTDSPNTHASKHFEAVGHPIMRSLEEGDDWQWCFVDEQQFRPSGDRFLVVDLFLEAGLWYAYNQANREGRFATSPGAVNEDGFPIGDWADEYRGARAALDPEQVAALEALPGWAWADPPTA